MSESTSITWTDHTFNPWWGCAHVSPGCANCYAETLAARYGSDVWGKTAPRRFFGDKHWAEPLKWNRRAEQAGKRARVFCASMADVFEDRPELEEPRRRLWNLTHDTPRLDWQILTKRPENVQRMVPWTHVWPINLWLGTSVEDQQRADERVPVLLEIPAAIRFLSCEPLLGPVELWPSWVGGRPRVDWIIVGGESGKGYRPMDHEWLRRIVELARIYIPVFVKQNSGPRPGMPVPGGPWPQEFPS